MSDLPDSWETRSLGHTPAQGRLAVDQYRLAKLLLESMLGHLPAGATYSHTITPEGHYAMCASYDRNEVPAYAWAEEAEKIMPQVWALAEAKVKSQGRAA